LQIYLGVSPDHLPEDAIITLKEAVLSLDGARQWLEQEDMSVASAKVINDEYIEIAFYSPKFNKIFFCDHFFALTRKNKLSALLHECVHARVRKNGRPSLDYFYLQNNSFEPEPATVYTEQQVFDIQRNNQIEISKGNLNFAIMKQEHRGNFIKEMGTDDYESAVKKFKDNSQARIKLLLKNPDTLAALIIELSEIAYSDVIDVA